MDTQSAELILCGKDKQKLEQISEKLFWDTTIVAGKDDEEIISQLDEEDVTAVIGLTGEDGIEDLMKKGILKEDASIILLDKEEKKMPRLSAKYPALRICSLVYNEKSLDIVNENWTYEFMKKNLPIEMIRPTYGACERNQSCLRR